jgi:hypothetical protein
VAIADLSYGHDGVTHPGVSRGTVAGIIPYCQDCAPPLFVIDPTAPNFVSATPAAPVAVPTPPATPPGALVADSFSRAKMTLVFNGKGGLGATETGSEGSKQWLSSDSAGSPQSFGLLNGVGVSLGNRTAITWVPVSAADIDVRVERKRGKWGSGHNTGLSFRVSDAANYFFAYSSSNGTETSLTLGYFESGVRHELASGLALPSGWTTLRVLTRTSGQIDVFADQTLVLSLNSPVLANASGAGIYNDGPGLGLTNRWDNFWVFHAP